MAGMLVSLEKLGYEAGEIAVVKFTSKSTRGPMLRQVFRFQWIIAIAALLSCAAISGCGDDDGCCYVDLPSPTHTPGATAP